MKLRSPDMDEECGHQIRKNGICTACGLCSSNSVFADAPVMSTSKTSCAVGQRYAVKNQFKHYDCVIDKILAALRLECYKPMLKMLLNTNVFKIRLSMMDRAIVALYHLLKLNDFPITVADLLQYTPMSKFRLLRAHRDSFEYEEPSNAYLRAIYDREAAQLEEMGIQSHGSFEDFLRYKTRNISADAADVCDACLLAHASTPNAFKSFKIASRSRKEKVRKMLKKMKMAACASR